MSNIKVEQKLPHTYKWALGKADYSFWRPSDSYLKEGKDVWKPSQWTKRDLKDAVAVVSTLILPEEYSHRRAACIGQGIQNIGESNIKYRSGLKFLEDALAKDGVLFQKTDSLGSIIISRNIEEGKFLKQIIDFGSPSLQSEIQAKLYGIPDCDAWNIDNLINGKTVPEDVVSGVLHDYRPHSVDCEPTINNVQRVIEGLQKSTPEFENLIMQNFEKWDISVFSPLEVKVLSTPPTEGTAN